ncbi:MAG: cupin domain-containing protein [Burkholderiaceae bacterium]
MYESEFPGSRIGTAAGERAVVTPGAARWADAPVAGVERMILDSEGDGIGARLTGFMRFAPGSGYPEHEHAAGEEILVLAGTLSDEHGSHHAGTYVRNAPGSRHEPHSPGGCTLFIKLRQFPADDRGSHLVDTRRLQWSRGRAAQASVMPLHAFGAERTRLVHWRSGVGGAPVRHPGGAELLVLAGDFADEHGRYPPGTWMRLPDGCWHRPRAGRRGVLIWIKTGHLPASARAIGAIDRTAEAAA